MLLMKRPSTCPISYLWWRIPPHPKAHSVVHLLEPGQMAFVSKGQPYDMVLVMGRGQLLGKTYSGFT